jgi:hypothetical protein
VNPFRILPALLVVVVVSACSSNSSTISTPAPTPTPTPTPTPVAPTLTKPTPVTPLDVAQLDNVRPTVTVDNGTSNQTTPAKTYDFQIADNSAFTLNANFNEWYATTVVGTSVPEDPSGRTSFTPTADLQPTTKYYWRARLVQGSTNSDWSDVRTFTTKRVGYNRPGALYDPLVNSETIGTISGSRNVTWVPGQGIRINDQFAYVLYTLPQTYSSGEMSAEVTGLAPNGEPGKGRIFSILDRLNVLSSAAKYSINVQYRGADGVPSDCITFKSILGDNDHSVEAADRYRNIFHLDPSKVYLFSVFWTPTSVRVVVKEGGATGFVLYDELATATSGTTNWNPDVMYAYVGTSNANYTSVDGSRVGMIFRNFWVGSTPRPASLGSALDAGR